MSERDEIVMERLWKAQKLAGGVLSGIVGLEEVNMLTPSDDPVTKAELVELEEAGRVDRPYGGDDGWRCAPTEWPPREPEATP